MDDLHWKTINYLTENYKNILIGDMSVKSIISNETSNLTKMTKRIANSLRFYEFRTRLEYKCKCTCSNYYKINERFTSKMCSNCGWINENLKGQKIFNCKECKKIIDRDVNGSRNIYIKKRMEK